MPDTAVETTAFKFLLSSLDMIVYSTSSVTLCTFIMRWTIETLYEIKMKWNPTINSMVLKVEGSFIDFTPVPLLLQFCSLDWQWLLYVHGSIDTKFKLISALCRFDFRFLVSLKGLTSRFNLNVYCLFEKSERKQIKIWLEWGTLGVWTSVNHFLISNSSTIILGIFAFLLICVLFF